MSPQGSPETPLSSGLAGGLRESPFSSGLAGGLHAVAWALILPCYWCLDRLIAVFLSTTLERSQRRGQERYLHPLKVLCGSVLFVGLVVTTAPLALLGFLLWAPLQASRRPFCYQRQTGPRSAEEGGNHRGFELGGEATFGFATANVCLLPDSMARFNNLGHTQRRADAIGRAITQAVGRPRVRNGVTEASSASSAQPPTNTTTTNRDSRQQDGVEVTGEVSPLFPADLDILCLQEVFDKRAAEKLAGHLLPLFGHILYDVGVYGRQPPGSCFKLLNSGLLVASRFPVLEARYRCFPNGRGADALAAKGLLSAKVLVGHDRRRKRVVGYFSGAHLQAPRGDAEIRCEQLSMVTEWIGEFRAASGRPDEEEVAFDVLCGDFNFDNCSPRDRREQRHGVFEEYRDPCRAGPGREKPWAVGTLLEQHALYQEETRTPKNLRQTLEDEGSRRRRFVSPPVAVPGGSPLVYPEPGQPWVGRRIDYVLYGRSAVSESCWTRIEEFTFVTQLAGLTDHIPVGLRLNVLMESHRTDEGPIKEQKGHHINHLNPI